MPYFCGLAIFDIVPVRVLRDLVPPLVWRAGVRVLRGRSTPTYQGVTSLADLSALHRGRFATVFDEAFPNNPDLRPDGNLTRLRAYTTMTFAAIALRGPGDVVSIGISYGVTPKVVYELVVKGRDRNYHLVDPFWPKDGANYADDPAPVMAQFGGDPCVRLHRNTAPEALPLPLDRGLAFAELCTGDQRAELASLPYLIDQLTPQGVIVIDDYGWGPSTVPYDRIAEYFNAQIFVQPTGQGVLTKRPANRPRSAADRC